MGKIFHQKLVEIKKSVYICSVKERISQKG